MAGYSSFRPAESGVVGRDAGPAAAFEGARGCETADRGNVWGAEGFGPGLLCATAEVEAALLWAVDGPARAEEVNFDNVPRLGGAERTGTPLLFAPTTVLRLVV